MSLRTVNRLVLGFVISAGLFHAGYAHSHGGAAGMFQQMDTNGDGKISPEEHAAGAKKMFDMMDTNGDGKVTADEMTAAHEKMMAKAGDEKDKDAKHESAKHEDAKHEEMSAADKIKVVDTNGDGVLTADEHAAGAKMMFDKMDTNHDGFLSKAELAAGHAKMMHKSK
jgi:Ca2+-binding EF-hand superfamily protein